MSWTHWVKWFLFTDVREVYRILTSKKPKLEFETLSEAARKRRALSILELTLEKVNAGKTNLTCRHVYVLEQQVWHRTGPRSYELRDEVKCAKCNHKTIKKIG